MILSHLPRLKAPWPTMLVSATLALDKACQPPTVPTPPVSSLLQSLPAPHCLATPLPDFASDAISLGILLTPAHSRSSRSRTWFSDFVLNAISLDTLLPFVHCCSSHRICFRDFVSNASSLATLLTLARSAAASSKPAAVALSEQWRIVRRLW